MKYLFFKSLIILILYFFSFNEAITCPGGFTQYSIDRRFVYSEKPYFFCDVTIVFCCKWDNSLKEVAIEWDYISKTNTTNCMAHIPDEKQKDFWKWVDLQIVNYADSVCAPPYPPCDDTTNIFYEFKEFKPRCGKFKNLIRYTGDPTYSLLWYPCYSDITCVDIYRICTDYSGGEPKIIIEFIRTEFTGYAECSTEIPQMPPTGKTWDEPWETECFKVNCVDYP